MPIYEFKCEDCGFEVEARLVKNLDQALKELAVEHPACNFKLIISQGSFKTQPSSPSRPNKWRDHGK